MLFLTLGYFVLFFNIRLTSTDISHHVHQFQDISREVPIENTLGETQKVEWNISNIKTRKRTVTSKESLFKP